MDNKRKICEINIKQRHSFKKIVLLILIITAAAVGSVYAAMHIKIETIRSDAARASKILSEEGAASAEKIDLANALRTSTVNEVIKGESIPSYSTSQIMDLDVSKPSGVTVSDLKLVTKGGLSGLEEAFYKAVQDYGINCLFVMAIAAHESANGTMCFRPNNMFGFGSSGFSSKAEGIDVVSKTLANSYLSPGGSLYSGKTISSVNKKYAASTTWDDKVARNMVNYYSIISKKHNDALNKLK